MRTLTGAGDQGSPDQGPLYFQCRTHGVAGGMEGGRERISDDLEHKIRCALDRLAQDLVVPRQEQALLRDTAVSLGAAFDIGKKKVTVLWEERLSRQPA